MDDIEKILKNIDIDAWIKKLNETEQQRKDCVSRNHAAPDGKPYEWKRGFSTAFFSEEQYCSNCRTERTVMKSEEERREIERMFRTPMMYRNA